MMRKLTVTHNICRWQTYTQRAPKMAQHGASLIPGAPLFVSLPSGPRRSAVAGNARTAAAPYHKEYYHTQLMGNTGATPTLGVMSYTSPIPPIRSYIYDAKPVVLPNAAKLFIPYASILARSPPRGGSRTSPRSVLSAFLISIRNSTGH